ncbi:MAG: S-methyl-5-thioribose kinase [Bacillota bacterium]
MSRFDRHFRMNEEDAIRYAKEKLSIFSGDAVLECREIGDGNINYIFRVWEPATGKSVILKHADVTLRSNPNSRLTTDRSKIEAEALRIQWDLAPDTVPEVYCYDAVMCCLSMEDLSDHDNMRYALVEHRTFPMFAEHITDFLVNTLLKTSDIVMEPLARRELSTRFVNPLCRITEDLVYTDPYTNKTGWNVVFPPIRDFVQEVLYDDVSLRLEAAKLKNRFLSHNQALIHGDLHTGSILVKEDSTKVIDPEFAFFGPMGFDLGNVVGNLFFAWANGFVTIEDPVRQDSFLGWVEKTVVDVVDLFVEKFRKAFHENVRDVMFRTDGFLDWYLNGVLRDTAGVAGLEMHRRTVGDAKVRDLISIQDEAKRALAERIVILSGKAFIMNRDSYLVGEDYVRTVKEIAGQCCP